MSQGQTTPSYALMRSPQNVDVRAAARADVISTVVAPPPIACSLWDSGYIDCLLGQVGTTITTRVFEAIRPFLIWLNQNPLNFVTRTPEAATYKNEVVQRFVSFGITVVDAALAVRVLLIAYRIMVGRSIGLPALSVMEALPRLALLVIVAHNSLLICQWLIDFNNALCSAVDGLFQLSLLQLAIQALLRGSPEGTINLLLLFALSLFLAGQVLFLAWQMLVRLATVVLLTSLSPLAFLSEAWLRRWASAFVAAVLVQFLQVSALALGGMLAGFFAGKVFAGFSDQLVISLFVSNALFFLVLRIPHTLHEYILSPTVAAGETTAHAISAIGGRFARTL
ncbi:hypothetical protein KSF_066790 [Reticulibacter mediterranei]|uniref:Uncharacterized protein n=1 Tax=Reticulibacter mediterranei TaxID=2778369 RepID=A0A8J3IUV3_9CHLR|nr:hypothetical protein [Reticulibacter mediterranei]GHO96631.1 hypothetical protein KSF_066790 [Reticulibacter mediterranei]